MVDRIEEFLGAYADGQAGAEARRSGIWPLTRPAAPGCVVRAAKAAMAAARRQPCRRSPKPCCFGRASSKAP